MVELFLVLFTFQGGWGVVVVVVGRGKGVGGVVYERSLGFKADIHFRRSLFLLDFLGSQYGGQILGN